MAFAGKTKHEILSEFRTAEILQAARTVFAEKGFSEATVDEIAEAAGLAKGTIYLYFPSKKEIYLAALKNGVAELAEATRKNMEAAGGIRGKVHAFIQTRLEHVERNRDFFKIYHAEFGNLTHPLSVNESFRKLYRQQLDALEAILEKAAEGGEIRKTPVGAIASALYEMTRGLMLRRLLGWSGTTVEEDVETLNEFVWRGIGNS
ncbi:MAG: TetR/AcrR family transcriptional regulator [Bryobacterales bacterium]|nr:TetR/AcrR family transcriptional regulator [Bryobacterales bacterium]